MGVLTTVFQHIVCRTAVRIGNMSAEIIIHRDDIVKEGWLVKQSKHSKEWRRRWCVLTPQYLFTFKQQGELRIRLRECSTVKSVEEKTGNQNSFRVVIPGREFHF